MDPGEDRRYDFGRAVYRFLRGTRRGLRRLFNKAAGPSTCLHAATDSCCDVRRRRREHDREHEWHARPLTSASELRNPWRSAQNQRSKLNQSNKQAPNKVADFPEGREKPERRNAPRHPLLNRLGTSKNS